jgi:hypothetical protein
MSRVLPCVCAALLGGCKPSVFQEIVNQGGTRFFNKAKVSQQTNDGNLSSYTFEQSSGPECLTGEPFTVSVRDTGSDGLFIFLQGGGACWSSFCLAVTAAPAGIPTCDILNPGLASNPLADWSTVYLPYCDGSLFVGDSDWSSQGNSTIDRHQHGLQNLSAALDIAVQRFPNPSRIVLAGSSGGGYGTILAAPLVRIRYPNPPILVFDDSGIGLGQPGDPAFIDGILQQFNAQSLIPKSCSGCTADGNVTRLVDWQLDRDPQMKMGVFSSYEDGVISQLYLQIPAATFESSLLSTTDWLHGRYETRYRRFFVNGIQHTSLLGNVDGLIGDDPTAVILPANFVSSGLADVKIGGIDTTEIDGVTIAQWFQAMLDGTAAWDDRLESPDGGVLDGG